MADQVEATPLSTEAEESQAAVASKDIPEVIEAPAAVPEVVKSPVKKSPSPTVVEPEQPQENGTAEESVTEETAPAVQDAAPAASEEVTPVAQETTPEAEPAQTTAVATEE